MNNELLKKLQEQALFVDNRYALPDEFADEFARLIIEECAKVADRAWNDAGTYPGNLVRKHFGID